MKKRELQTPAILVDLDILDYNIKRVQSLCNSHGKQLWPMVKTHKSTEIVKLQEDAGSTGFLCGTLDECEGICKLGVKTIMYAYPVANQANLQRVVELAQKCHFIARIDSYPGAQMLNHAAEAAGVKVNYTIIIDCGLHRFGIAPDQAEVFADSLKEFNALLFKGISTHPGHVYSAAKPEDIPYYVDQERTSLKKAADALRAAGYSPELITSGSTPTFFGAVSAETINVFHPGNYVFNDCIQMSTNTAGESECALSVLTTVISHPSENLFICDAGAKCLGLDQGAHGNTALKGFGFVKGHPELTVCSLSEEVSKFQAEGSTTLKVGDMVEIIPNHACSTANLTSYLIGCRGDSAEKLIKVDMRGNATMKNFV
ncbi:alanine racemase [Desulfosporosinus sp. PR]|uniref:alanine racemase n=1 Tax=Candidatus Desulfosporosinus nitrosoreducens TaxID=3401928 RepID=UPI0027EEE0E4|nr:alanine racemase [Desulfosporosinus sp. PR]MDQ7097134.1 alanine racemase [Desulfosporosinus sp. PR]